ncbi:MAG: NAD(P)-dependent oxidoreductase, partial [Anaerolineae bacterium]|nr:NAD(P)-dependent oxidoreductase [Anaerolineae bacterium]
MNILILGGSGLFGRKTAAHLLADPEVESVVSLDLAPPPEWFLLSVSEHLDRFHEVRGNVAELEDILNAMRRYRVDSMINWAFIMVAQSVQVDPRLVTRVNVMGMCNAFEAAKLMGARRVIYASSETVYGPQAMYGMREVTEDDPTNPTHSYAVCKKYAEILAADYAGQFGLSITGVRPTIGYGHGGRSPAQYWSDMPSLCAVGQPFTMEGDGRGLASLVSADDLAAFTRLLVVADSAPHPVYNVGGPPTTPRQMAEAVKRYLPDAQIAFGARPMADPKGEQGLPWLVSMARATADFGF